MGIQPQYTASHTGWTTENKGIQIISDIPVAAVAASYGNPDIVPQASFLVKPSETLGKTYYAITSRPSYSYRSTCQVTAVALSDSTSVSITLNDGTKDTSTLNSLQIRTFSNGVELTGSKIQSDKPIAVIANCACVHSSGCRSSRCNEGCGPEAQMMIPVSGYQTEFPLLSFESTEQKNIVTIVPAQDSTQISLDGSALTTLNNGGSYDFSIDITYAGVLSATKPVTVSQAALRYSPDNLGSVFMVGVPSKQQFITGDCLFSTLIPADYCQHFRCRTKFNSVQFINVITVGDISQSMFLNNVHIENPWFQIESSEYYYVKIQIPPGNYTVS